MSRSAQVGPDNGGAREAAVGAVLGVSPPEMSPIPQVRTDLENVALETDQADSKQRKRSATGTTTETSEKTLESEVSDEETTVEPDVESHQPLLSPARPPGANDISKKDEESTDKVSQNSPTQCKDIPETPNPQPGSQEKESIDNVTTLPPAAAESQGSSEADLEQPKRMSKKALNFLGFDTEEQLNRAKALGKLGLTEDDMYKSSPFFTKPPSKERKEELYQKRGLSQKVEYVTGFSSEQILRRKAVATLGSSELEIETDRTQRLSEMGNEFEPKSSSSAASPGRPSCIER
mmetsp:Transcript_15602/g.28613  ORF Transcript_15602/g.28613 Transcript_15602/m.28613 type:complete len:292 (-) Transcript_15602:131-1006(-)